MHRNEISGRALPDPLVEPKSLFKPSGITRTDKGGEAKGGSGREGGGERERQGRRREVEATSCEILRSLILLTTGRRGRPQCRYALAIMSVHPSVCLSGLCVRKFGPVPVCMRLIRYLVQCLSPAAGQITEMQRNKARTHVSSR